MSFTCLSYRVTVATDKFEGNKKDVVDRVIGLIKMFGNRSRIRKVAIVENEAAMLDPKALVEIRRGLPNVLFAHFWYSMRWIYLDFISRNLREGFWIFRKSNGYLSFTFFR